MIDPQAALAQAIAHARSQQQIMPQPNAANPHAIHQMAASLAQRIAGSRAPIGRATVGMFPQPPQQQQPQYFTPQMQAPDQYYRTTNQHILTPTGTPQEAGSGDYGFFGHWSPLITLLNGRPANNLMGEVMV